MIILGLNAFHGDAAACVVRDGQLVAAAEEERFRRVKHWAGLPTEASAYCLAEAGVSLADVDCIAINRDPSANAVRKAWFALSRRPSFKAVTERLKNAGQVRSVKEELARALGLKVEGLRAEIHNVEHHIAHLASAFLVSPFQDAAVVSVDGFGDFVSTKWALGNGQQITPLDQIFFPHSLGLFYLAITQHLGFPNYGDEYKVMGLAPYGQPNMMEPLRRMLRLLPDGQFELDLEYFRHHSESIAMVFDEGEPRIDPVYSEALEDLLGPQRDRNAPLEARHKDIAASAQAMYEEAFFHILNHVHRATGTDQLALAGGCAMNSVANGKIFERSPFRDVYVQSAAGDAGGAIGAAFVAMHERGQKTRAFEMTHAYWGPGYSHEEIASLIAGRIDDLKASGCEIERVVDELQLCERTAHAISRGKVIGWFQGRMEWGPRALGNRSILGDPRRADMKDILNIKIKRRESFRPFAPSILREHVKDWFETDYDVPFMLQVFQIRAANRERIPAVTHVNGSGRLQTVSREQNARYHQLIDCFYRITGVPMLLNTSFNENEPVVCRPQEALECFLRTKMDILVMGDHIIERKGQE